MVDVKEALVPDLGHERVPVIEVLVKPGDTVSVDQGLVTLESDKATMELPAPYAGVIKEIKLKVGDEVSQGTLIALIEVASEAVPTEAASVAPASAPAESAPAAPSAAPASAEPASGGGLREVRVPDIGSEDVPVIELLVQVGATVSKDQGLVTLESDKATMEVPAPFEGVVRELKVSVGDTVSPGSLLAMIETAATSAPAPESVPAIRSEAAAERPSAAAVPAESPKATVSAVASPGPRPPFDARIVMPGDAPYASPAVRAFARDLGVEVHQVKGSGRGGRSSGKTLRPG